MSSYISKRVLCPFYKDAPQGRQIVMCEGVEKQTSIHLAFGHKKQQFEYMEEYCCKDYDTCRIADMLYKKYDDEDEVDDD